MNNLLFCQTCGTLLDMPSDDRSQYIPCDACGSNIEYSEFEKRYEVVTRSRPNAFHRQRQQQNKGLQISEEDSAGAIIDEKCEKCGHHQMKFFTMQLRSADEGQTVFYTCTRCNYTYSLNS